MLCIVGDADASKTPRKHLRHPLHAPHTRPTVRKQQQRCGKDHPSRSCSLPWVGRSASKQASKQAGRQAGKQASKQASNQVTKPVTKQVTKQAQEVPIQTKDELPSTPKHKAESTRPLSSSIPASKKCVAFTARTICITYTQTYFKSACHASEHTHTHIYQAIAFALCLSLHDASRGTMPFGVN